MKANKLILFIIILLISTSGFSQDRNTRKIGGKCYHIELNLGKLIIKEDFHIDSLHIKSKVYKQKISSKIKFQKSKNKIRVDIYFDKNKNIMMIHVIEQSPTFITYTEAKKYTSIYFKKGNNINERIRYRIPFQIVESGIATVYPDEQYGCNKNLTTLYLEKLSNRIIEKVKE